MVIFETKQKTLSIQFVYFKFNIDLPQPWVKCFGSLNMFKWSPLETRYMQVRTLRTISYASAPHLYVLEQSTNY